MKRLLPLIFSFAVLTAQAQSKLSEKPAEFVGDVKAMLSAGKVENAEKLSADLEEIWNSGKLSPKQQKQVIDISQHMYRKGIPGTRFGQFYTMVTAGINNQHMRPDQLDKMLEVTEKVVQQEETKRLEQFLTTASLYLSSNYLYQNGQYSLRTAGGSFSFAYEGTSKAQDKVASKGSWDDVSWDDDVDAAGNVVEEDTWGTVSTNPKKEDKQKTEKARKENLKQLYIPEQPKVTGPVLKLEKTNLVFVTPWDSVTVANTQGQLMLVLDQFVGEGGEFKWQVKGEPASAELRKYSLSTSSASFKAPDVTLTYAAVLAAPVEGALEWMSRKRKSGNYPYPKFSSFTNDAQVKNIGGNIAYKGGFSLAGNEAGSKPLDGSLSEIIVSHNGERKFGAWAQGFAMEDSVLMANRASVTIYQHNDSLSHPAVQLRYSKASQELTLTKDKGPYADMPFFDNFHQIELSAERLQWKLNEPNIEFSILNTKSLVPMYLESSGYFSNSRYQRLVGVTPFHPLQMLVGYATKVKKGNFYAADVAKTNKINEAAIKEAALSLSYQGYVNYDPASGYIELKQKALHYVASAREAKDYDHIVIKSIVPSGRNATLDLQTQKLTVRGVERIVFNNDTASVYILPRRNEVHILKNRDIEFDGQVYANRISIKGAEFRFNYNDFTLDLPKIDTLALLKAEHKGPTGNLTEQVLTGSAGGTIKGKLYINKPDNKSGLKSFPEYPRFDAISGAKVSFAGATAAEAAYDSTVYFEMPPFKLDSLGSKETTVGLDGAFNSGGIFPPIKTKMVMMPDGTLGFYYHPGEKGLPAYGGKGMVYDTIMLSSAGIQSKGMLKYLSATIKAPAFTYHKNGVLANGGTSVNIAEGSHNGTEFPAASLSGFNMNWQPQADTMYLQTVKEPLKLYKEGFAFTGGAKLSPGGLFGSGVLDNHVANVSSKEMRFKQRSFTGNHAQMIVKSDVEGRPAVKAQDVAFVYDLANGFVDFESEQKGTTSMEFPKAQYKTSMSSARWDMNQQKVSLKADESGGKNWFYSLLPAQEGLRFMAASGEYDLKSNNLLAGGVPYIAVADVHVVPDNGHVAVAADATIQTLRNARVLADSAQQYHKLYKGNIDIMSRITFKGDAVLDYQNAADEAFQLQFADFVYGNPEDQKKPRYTYAATNMQDSHAFYIFPRILYRGKVTMQAPRQYLDFDGELKLNFTGNPEDADWFPYKQDTLNPAKVRIPIINPKAADGTPLHTGIHVSENSGKFYSTFVSKKQAEDDLDLFAVDGLLSYNKASKEFVLGQEKRAYSDTYEGNVLYYNEASKAVHFEGKLNLLKPLKEFAVEASGSGNAQADSSKYDLDAFLVFDLKVPEKALAAMAGALKGNAVGTVSALEINDALLYKLGAFVGDKEVRRYVQQSAATHMPLPKLSKKFARSLVLNEVKLQWSNEQNAWYSVGGISLSNILQEDVNARMDGYIEMRQDMNGLPAVTLYMQADPYTWYYFSFLENGMTMASSDDKFNRVVASKSKGVRGSMSSYAIYAGEPIDKNQFIEHFRTAYLDGKDGFKVATEQIIPEPADDFDYLEDEPRKEKKKKKRNKNNPEEEAEGIDLDNQYP